MELLSPSSMNLFFSCPLRWKWEKEGKEGIVVDESAMIFGKAVHSAIEEFFRRVPENPDLKNIDETAKECFEECKKIVEGHQKAKLDRILSNFISFEKKRIRTWKHYNPTLVEEKLTSSVFVGIIDFYSKEERTAIDWKTGSVVMDSEFLRQGKIYEVLLRENNYPVDRILFFSLDTGVTMPVPKVTDGWLAREVERMRSLIEQNRFYPNRGFHCKSCPYMLDCDFEGFCFWREVDVCL
jgi:hypothetical protein